MSPARPQGKLGKPPRLRFAESLERRDTMAFNPLAGLNFSPYIKAEESPDLPVQPGEAHISDATLLARMTTVAPLTNSFRSFGCNEDLEEIGQYAHQLGKTAKIGAWIGRDDAENLRQIDCLVEQAIQGHVDVAIVGSESLLRQDVTSEKLVGYLTNVKTRLTGLGISIPVVTADVYTEFIKYPAVTAATDEIYANFYPFWEAVPIEAAMHRLHTAYRQLADFAGGKKVVISETGWPSAGEPLGFAIPSPQNAAYYFANFLSWAEAEKVDYNYFEAFDEQWKISEGVRGTAWGILESSTESLKPGMAEVLLGARVADNWTVKPAGPAPIDFFSSSAPITTNLAQTLVTGLADRTDVLTINGAPVEPRYRTNDSFAAPVALNEGDNSITVRIESTQGTVRTVTRSVVYDRQMSTTNRELLYADVAAGVVGTVVLDLSRSQVLGFLPSVRVRDASADGATLYLDDGSLLDTSTHTVRTTIPFTSRIASNGFVLTGDGKRLISGNQVWNLESSSLETPLPISLTTGSSWASAPIPGGPAGSPDGSVVCGGNTVVCVNLATRQRISTGIVGNFMSDIAISPRGDLILVSEYSSGIGWLRAYDFTTRKLVFALPGLGDFAGEIAFLSDDVAVIGSSGGTVSLDGGVTLVDLAKGAVLERLPVHLADNIATSPTTQTVYATSGSPGGIEVLTWNAQGRLSRTATYRLGLNQLVAGGAKPERDQIRRLVYKSATPPPLLADLDGDRDVDSADLASVLSHWTGATLGGLGGRNRSTGDLDGDEDVDSADLLVFLSQWTGSQNASVAPTVSLSHVTRDAPQLAGAPASVVAESRTDVMTEELVATGTVEQNSVKQRKQAKATLSRLV